MRVDLSTHDDVSHRLRNRKHRNFAGRFGLVIDTVRWPKKKSLHTQVAFQKQFGEIQLKLKLRFRNGLKIGMREGVIAYFISEVELTLHDSGILICGLADYKEGRRDLFLMQNVNDSRSPVGIGTIVECKSYFVRSVSHLIDAPGKRIGLERLVGEKIGVGIVFELTPAALRSGGNAPYI